MPNNAHDRELLKRFSLFGPPGNLRFSTRKGVSSVGRSGCLIGYQNKERFLETLVARVCEAPAQQTSREAL